MSTHSNPTYPPRAQPVARRALPRWWWWPVVSVTVASAVFGLGACTPPPEPPGPAPAVVPTAIPNRAPALPAPTNTPAPIPVGERVQLVSPPVSRQFYTVYGSTTDEIFRSIERLGPTGEKGERATGLAAAKRSYEYATRENRTSCATSAMTVTLAITVTLPKLDNPSRLSSVLLARWENFAAAVAAHEQRHVDIYLAGAAAMTEKMRSILPSITCAGVKAQVDAVWSSQETLTDQEQERFHEEDRARILASRQPIQAQRDANDARLRDLRSQAAAIDADLAAMKGQIDGLGTQIAGLKRQMESIERRYPNLVIPEPTYGEYERLRTQHNSLVSQLSPLVDRHNSTLGRSRTLADQDKTLVGEINGLVEQLNWIQ